MAAGLGTRLGPFTHENPKALLPVMGIPVAQFTISSLPSAVDEIVVNIHHQAEKSRRGWRKLKLGKLGLRFSDEEALLLGSAGGLKKSFSQLKNPSPFFWLNADVMSDVDLIKLAHAHARLRSQYGVNMTLALFPRSRTGEAYREIIVDPKTSLVQGFGEAQTQRPYFLSIAIIEPEALEEISDSVPSEFVPKILTPQIAKRKVGAWFAEGVWHDIGSPKLWLETHTALIEQLESGQISAHWRNLIEAQNQRLSPQVWTSSWGRRRRHFNLENWQGPSYWHDGGYLDAKAPPSLGPNAVYYGDIQELPGGQKLSNGIGYHSNWVSQDL